MDPRAAFLLDARFFAAARDKIGAAKEEMRSRLLPILALVMLAALPAAAHTRTLSEPNGVLQPHLSSDVEIESEIALPPIITDAPDTLPVFTRSRKLASWFFELRVEPNIQRMLDLGEESRLGDDSMHARYYNPNLGRFLSTDPGKDWDPKQPQTWNLYSYVRNNPVNATDPTGRCTLLGGNYTLCQQIGASLAKAFVDGAENSWFGNMWRGAESGDVDRMQMGSAQLLHLGLTVSLFESMGASESQTVDTTVGGGFANPKAIRFSQDSIARTFKDGGGPVDDLVAGLKSGKVKPADVPAIRVFEKDGKVFTLDNRRLYAFKEAGMTEIAVRKASVREVEDEAWKFTTRNDGTSVRVRN